MIFRCPVGSGSGEFSWDLGSISRAGSLLRGIIPQDLKPERMFSGREDEQLSFTVLSSDGKTALGTTLRFFRSISPLTFQFTEHRLVKQLRHVGRVRRK